MQLSMSIDKCSPVSIEVHLKTWHDCHIFQPLAIVVNLDCGIHRTLIGTLSVCFVWCPGHSTAEDAILVSRITLEEANLIIPSLLIL